MPYTSIDISSERHSLHLNFLIQNSYAGYNPSCKYEEISKFAVDYSWKEDEEEEVNDSGMPIEK
jgi:hypothetical protein